MVGIAFLVVAVCSSLACPTPRPPIKTEAPPVFLLILVDVTRSLEKSEVRQVAKLASDVLDRFPANTDYTIYPIQWETQKPTAVDEGHPRSSSQPLTEDEKGARRKRIDEKIERYFTNVNEKQPTDRSCILNTLHLADKHFYQATGGSPGDPTKQPCMEMVIISDMIEQCAINPSNQGIDLQEIPISEALELVKQIPSLPNLSRLHISVIIPTAEDATPYARNRPSLGDLETFWNAVFLRCGFKQEDLRGFNWLPTVPARFQQVCQPSPSPTPSN
jgi:hypothetical protein